MPPRRKLRSFRGPLPERFTTITWDEANRRAHEERRPVPAFSATLHLDWSRVMKRKDVEHPGPPDRFQAIVGRSIGDRVAIYFVVYTKVSGSLHVISVRWANADERKVFLSG